jgi:DNA-binding LacI/PurR family transcriptional regulator
LKLHSYEIPVVAINNQAEEDYQYSIYHDDVDGGGQVCKHLVSLGHTTIGYLGDASSGRTTRERLTGFQQAMQKAGLSINDKDIHQVQGNSAMQGYQAMDYFLELAIRPTALICYNDMMAVGVLKRLREAGLKVPEDISVTGFDNIMVSDFTNPTLTTIDQPKRFLGAEAARMMLEQLNIRNKSSTGEVKVKRLKGMLLIRQSTAAPYPD